MGRSAKIRHRRRRRHAQAMLRQFREAIDDLLGLEPWFEFDITSYFTVRDM